MNSGDGVADVRRISFGFLCSAVASFMVTPAFATGIGVGAVRIIYEAGHGQSLVPVTNTAAGPYLVQSRVSQTRGGHEATPFFVSPPLMRIEGGAKSVLRITGNTQSLPHDRESLFYLTVTGIPSSNPLARQSKSGFMSGSLNFAFATSLKVFYRPDNLLTTEEQAVTSLKAVRVGDGVSIENASPYYITFNDLKINGQSVKFGKGGPPDMISPFSSQTYPAGRAYPLNQTGKVTWQAITGPGFPVSSGTILQ
ncbi:fimbrial biogenesis chaperone [Enterobacter ludwigii]|uniref:fimbrial biogenesis chaperone n=1 Tax=Enterobacter ludwigii TaxID=299767 RepID=UPI001865CBC1|nr:molecular chaperone [Enterobacter ludwigii]